VSSIDPTAAFPFGHGIGYSTFDWSPLETRDTEIPVDGEVRLSLRVRNTGDRAGAEVVQVYLNDPAASVVLPVQRLLGFARVELAPGEEARIEMTVPTDLVSFTGRAGRRIVEPGLLVFGAGRSSGDIVSTAEVTLTGDVREVGSARALHPLVTVTA
jgi:beta-xylosidase